MSIPGMGMIFQGGQQDLGHGWASRHRCPAGTTTPAGWRPSAKSTSAAGSWQQETSLFSTLTPTQSASWPGLWVLPKHTAGCSPWIWLFRDVKCWRPRAALGVTAQAALPALPCAGCPSEWSRLGGSVAARQMLSCSHPRPIRQPDKKLGNP